MRGLGGGGGEVGGVGGEDVGGGGERRGGTGGEERRMCWVVCCVWRFIYQRELQLSLRCCLFLLSLRYHNPFPTPSSV